MQNLLDTIIKNNYEWTAKGKVATYIPALAKARKEALGIYVTGLDGIEYGAGDFEEKYTLQSMSKVIALMLAITDNGKSNVFQKVGMEPTGDSFNSIISLEVKNPEKPFNPMINAGAIVTSSLIWGKTPEEKLERILDFTRKITGNPTIGINEEVFQSERNSGDRNRALSYYMKSNGLIEGDVDEILQVYFSQCAIEGNCKDVSRIAAMLANDGVLPWTGERIISREVSRIVKTIMVTCGMYDASGEFAVHIGIPAKSGVSGGIMASVPRRMGIGVYAPALDEKGNSLAGMRVLQELSSELDLSIF